MYGDVTKWLENNQSYGAHDFKATQNETNDHVFTKIHIQSRFVFKLRTSDIYVYMGFKTLYFDLLYPRIQYTTNNSMHICGTQKLFVSHFGHDLKFKDDSSYLIFDDS